VLSFPETARNNTVGELFTYLLGNNIIGESLLFPFSPKLLPSILFSLNIAGDKMLSGGDNAVEDDIAGGF